MVKKIKSSTEAILKKSGATAQKEIDLTPFKPQDILSPKLNWLIAVGIFLFTMVIYQLTNAKTTSFWDAGEYIATSSIFGVPHPPGNPFYIILGRFFCIFSMGFDHAAVISFLSSLLSALAVMFTYLMTVQLLSMWKEDKFAIVMGGFIAAFLTAFSFTFWMNAIEAEVYAGLAFTINIIIWLTFFWVKNQKDFSHQNLLLLIVYIFFLGFGIHQTALQIAPAVLFIVVLPYIKDSLKKLSFWGLTALYTIGLFILYVIADAIGDSFSIPVLEKFIVGVAIFGIIYWYMRGYIDKRMWMIAGLLMLIGFSTHLYLLIRSEFRPFINEGHPHNFKLFMDYVLRRQYQAADASFMNRNATFWYQLDYHFLRYFSWQFLDSETVARWLSVPANTIKALSNILVASLGLCGFYYAYKRNKNAFWYLASLFFMSSLAMVFVMNQTTTEVRDRDYFYATAYNLWAVAMGIGAVGIVSLFSKSGKTENTENTDIHTSNTKRRTPNTVLKYIVIALLLFYPVFNLISQYDKHDRTGEYIALDYGLNILNSLEENAIIFTNGDNDTFPPWYAQATYDSHAKEHIYPATNVYPTEKTEELIKNSLEWKNSHIKGVRRDVSVVNLSLLNTPWYLKHIRDLEGVELNWTDDFIDTRLFASRIPQQIDVNITSPNGERFTITRPAETLMLVKDYAVLKIVQDNFGKRPIYFAITCAEYTGFDEYLVIEGMVQRIVSTRGGRERINYERLSNNLWNDVYQYRGIFNEGLYKDDNMIRLITNYGASYFRLAEHYNRLGNFDEVLKNYERGMQFILDPKEKLRFLPNLASAYIDAGRHDQAEVIIHQMINDSPTSVQAYMLGAHNMFRASIIDSFKASTIDSAFSFIEKGLTIDPRHRHLIGMCIQYGIELDQREKAHSILEKIASFEPGVRQLLPRLLDESTTLDDF